MQIQSTSDMVSSESKKKNSTTRNMKVIAVIVIIIVILAATYVYIDKDNNNHIYNDQPLGLSDFGKTTTTFTMGISSACEGAMVAGSEFSFIHNNTDTNIDNVTLYNPDTTIVAWYTPAAGWIYGNGFTADTLKFRVGITIIVTVNTGVSRGDKFIIDSSEGYFGKTTFTL